MRDHRRGRRGPAHGVRSRPRERAGDQRPLTACAARTLTSVPHKPPPLRADELFVPVSTVGDRWTGPLAEVGGKAVFTSAVTRAVLDGRADLALHCSKDMPGDSPEPERMMCLYPRRDDVRDVLVDPGGRRLDDLPAGTRVGTSASRRIAQLTVSHPHLALVPVRGNADTRLALARTGETVDAVVLAGAGLRRIGREAEATEVLDAHRMMPGLGAGQLAMQT
ncbi:hydroxymethylbilane synthase [Streptomyces sp. NPDC047024]|uniref:hydroxymethylbilane synthase n=1 Tax=Streptomyces sp. NPDC047024 TaxID=3155476 RepID=UPI0033FB5AC7